VGRSLDKGGDYGIDDEFEIFSAGTTTGGCPVVVEVEVADPRS